MKGGVNKHIEIQKQQELSNSNSINRQAKHSSWIIRVHAMRQKVPYLPINRSKKISKHWIEMGGNPNWCSFMVIWLRWYLDGMRMEGGKTHTHARRDSSIDTQFFHRATFEIRFVLLSVVDEGNGIETHQKIYTFSENGTSEMISNVNKKTTVLGNCFATTFVQRECWDDVATIILLIWKNTMIIIRGRIGTLNEVHKFYCLTNNFLEFGEVIALHDNIQLSNKRFWCPNMHFVEWLTEISAYRRSQLNFSFGLKKFKVNLSFLFAA